MSFLSKIGKGIKKLGSFTGKVLKGVASGGVIGGLAAGASNLGGGKSAQKATFASNSNTLSNTNPKSSLFAPSNGSTFVLPPWVKWTGVVVGGLIVLRLLWKYVLRKIFK